MRRRGAGRLAAALTLEEPFDLRSHPRECDAGQRPVGLEAVPRGRLGKELECPRPPPVQVAGARDPIAPRRIAVEALEHLVDDRTRP